MTKSLTALPVFNEVNSVDAVLNEVAQHSEHVLVVDDGSSDGTRDLLEKRDDIYLEVHPQNRGYGAALETAFQYAAKHNFEIVITIDCDGQHEPQRILALLKFVRTKMWISFRAAGISRSMTKTANRPLNVDLLTRSSRVKSTNSFA